MKWLKRFLACLFVFCLLPVAAQEQELTNRYLSIRDKLMNMKANSELVTEQLKMLSEDLKLSQQEAKQWETTSMTLSENLMSINEQLNNVYENLEAEHQKNKILMKVLATLIAILAIMILGKIAGYILYAKGVKLPRWLDILL